MVKLSALAIVLSLCLGLGLFAGQPAVAAYGHHDPRHRGWGGDKKDAVKYTGGGGKKGAVKYTGGGGKKDAVKYTGGGGKNEDLRDTVKRVVAEAIKGNSRVGAALIRLVFHDCWVNGCDGSVLLDSKPYVFKAEKEAENNIGLAGFDVIDKIKTQLASPEKFSCADIVVLAAREATFIVSRGKIDYKVKTGRTDGVVSSAAVADAILPPSTFNVDQLKANFAAKGFNTTELVALTGAHAVGHAHLSSFADRLDNTTETPISQEYMDALKKDIADQKKVQGAKNPIEPNNIRDMSATFRRDAQYNPTGVDTSDKGKGVLDNSFYHNEEENKVLFRSDWELRTDSTAGSDIAAFKADAIEWYKQFAKAMTKLSELPAVGPRFENRTNCREINQRKY